jgi:4-hydroxybenzoate polyprenyltransferase
MALKKLWRNISIFFRLIRWKNLVMIAILQYFLQYFFLIPKLRMHELEPVLNNLHFALLVICTMIIAAGGYIINDIYDYNIDRINKPDRQTLGRHLSLRMAMRYYFFVLGNGLIISLYLAWYVENLMLAGLYLIAVLSLWLYSKVLKRTALGGNFFVGLFCAFTAIIVAFAERETIINVLEGNWYDFKDLVFQFGIFSLFAFFSTLFREIVKDIEDIEGDKINNCHTLPIAYGIPFAKNVATSVNIILFIILLYLFIIFLRESLYWRSLYLALFIIAPVLISEFLLRKARSRKQFHFLSQFSKYIMFSGIFLILIMKVYS